MDFDLFRPEYSEKVDFMKQCAKYRLATKKYLSFGRLWEPVYPENEIAVFEEEFKGGGSHTGTAPSAEARLWQAEDGTLAIFIANYVNRETEFSYTIHPEKYGLPAGSYQLTEISPDGNQPLSIANGSISRTETLGPNKVKVIEFAPAK
jgi:hypothetical protein